MLFRNGAETDVVHPHASFVQRRANAQIAALEAKIASMQNSPLQTSAPGSRDGSGSPGPHGEGEGGEDTEMDFEQGVEEMIREVQDGEASSSTMEGGLTTKNVKTTKPIVPPVDKGKGKEKLHPSLPAKPPASTAAPTTRTPNAMQSGAGMAGIPARGQDRPTTGRPGR